MSLMLGALHVALLNPGNEELARRAAEEVADQQLMAIKHELGLLRRLVFINLTLTFLVLSLLIAMSAKLP